jgi:hypothetical protein
MPQLLSWGSATESTQLAICGGFSHRQAVRDFSIDAIELIAEAQIPVIWALHLPQSRSEFAFADVVKYLIGQVVQRNHTLLNERSASLNVARFQSAVTTDEWFSLLGAVLEGLPQVFFILDLEFMGQEGIGKLAWTDLFTRLFEDLRKRGSQIILKVLFLGFRSSHRARLSNFDQNKVLRLQTTRHCRISKTQDKFHSRKLSKNRGRALKSSYLGFDSGDKLEKIKR